MEERTKESLALEIIDLKQEVKELAHSNRRWKRWGKKASRAISESQTNAQAASEELEGIPFPPG